MKQPSAKTAKAKAIELAKSMAKTREDFTCQKCGRSKKDGWQMHGAHIIPVSYSKTASDPENILCLCASCHSMGGKSAHQNPIGFARWFEESHPGEYDRLWKLAFEYTKNPFPKIDWIQRLETLKGLKNEAN